MKQVEKIPVRCPYCCKLVLHKIGTASGELRLKCPHCSSTVDIDLSTGTGECVSVPTFRAMPC